MKPNFVGIDERGFSRKMVDAIRLRILNPIGHRVRLVEQRIRQLRRLGGVRLHILLISDGRSGTEAQYDPFRSRDVVRDLARRGVVVRHVSLRHAMQIDSSALAAYDIVGLKMNYLAANKDVESHCAILRGRMQSHAKLVFFDGDDDTGILRPRLLKQVDLYVKNQLLVDRSRYGASTIGKSNLTDFVATEHGVSFASDPIPHSEPIANPTDLDRVFLGWNVGTSRFIEKQLRKVGSDGDFEKDVDVSCRVTACSRSWTEPLRLLAFEQLNKLRETHRVIAATGHVPTHDYYAEMAKSRICVSPFGYGEICHSDFEAALYGCLLVKPDMSHLEAYPNLFVAGETYIPVRWDFSDLGEKCRYYLDHEIERDRIAARARQVLFEFFERRRVVEIMLRMFERLGFDSFAAASLGD